MRVTNLSKGNMGEVLGRVRTLEKSSTGHGVEHRGQGVTDAAGIAAVNLPDPQVSPDTADVFVTPQGATATWTGVAAGSFSVTAPAGTTFTWLVKGTRQ